VSISIFITKLAIILLCLTETVGSRAAAQDQVPSAKEMTRMFRQGQRQFQAKQFMDSYRTFQTLVNKNPKHQPSLIGLARSLYHLERIREASEVFTKVHLQFTDADTSYEYGYSFFEVQKWSNSLRGFRRIPSDHPLYSLANYFGAVAAVKLNRYDVAARMIDRAKNLPEKYAQSQKLYKEHIASVQKSGGKKEPLPPAPEAPAEKKQDEAPASEPEEYEHQGFQSTSDVAKLQTEYKVQYLGFARVKTEENNFRWNTLTLRKGKVFSLGTGTGPRPAIGIYGQLDGEQEDAIEVEEGYDVAPGEKARDQEFNKEARLYAGTFYEHPISEGYWGWVKLSFEQVYPDVGAELKGNQPYYELGIGRKGDISTQLEGRYSTYSAKGEELLNYAQGLAKVSGKVFEDYSWGVEGRFRQFNYARPDIEGEKTSYLTKITLGGKPFFDISIDGEVYYFIADDYGDTAGANKDIVLYDFATQGASLSVSRKFFDVISIKLSTKGETRDFSAIVLPKETENPNLEVEAHTAQYDFLSEFGGSLSIDMTF
jgi:TolA-binding protein